MTDVLSANVVPVTAYSEQIQRETLDFLQCLAEEFAKQLDFSGHELTQTQGLLKDAVDSLTSCFEGIHDMVAPGGKAMISPLRESELATSQAPPESLGLAYPSGGSPLENLLNTAIRTLQFQDLTKQLIDHALHRITAMHEVMNDILTVPGDGTLDQKAFLDALAKHRTAVGRHVAKLDEHKTNPVSQGHMRTGEIELF